MRCEYAKGKSAPVVGVSDRLGRGRAVVLAFLTIPIAVGVKLFGASKFIKKALSARPAVSIIAGATTTLPAMTAVYGITRKLLFFLYVAFTLFGALLFGYIFQLICFLF
ncbi:hypothetical protein ES703_77011 [subsurface metagenome]